MLTGLLCVVAYTVWQCMELMCYTGHIHSIHAHMYMLLYVHYMGCTYVYCSTVIIIRLIGI